MSDATVKRRIDNLDLKDIVKTARKECHWTAAEARMALKWYRCFLWVSYLHRHDGIVVIHPSADCLWHQHILNTPRYRADCEKIFGRYLDHVPFSGRLTMAQKEQAERSKAWTIEQCGQSPKPFINICYVPLQK